VGYIIDLLRRRGVTAVIDEDMLYVVTHMYSVSTGRPPHERLFGLSNISGKGYGIYSSILNRIANLAKRWGYGFVVATRIQARETGNTLFRDFLNRLAEAINVGEDLETFLQMEQETMLVNYEADYTRVLEALKLLLGIYTAAMSSAIFIDINVVMLSFFFGGIEIVFVSFIATVAALALLVLLIRKSLPRQNIVHDLRINMAERRLYLYTLLASVSMASVLGIYIFMMFKETSYFLITFGLLLFIPGIVGRRIENKVKNIENFFTVFIRSMGLAYTTLRNYAQTIRSILGTELGGLTKHLRRLYSRLRNGIDTRIAMLYFVGESGSETLRRGIDIFYDAIEAGGDPAKVGQVLSTTMQRLLNLRKMREQTARAFQGVVYILTILIVALAEFVFTLVIILQQVFVGVGATQLQILPLTYIETEVITFLKLGLIFAITILNAFALQFARGGYTGGAWIHAALLLVLSGATLLVSSMFSQMIFRVLQVGELFVSP